MCYKKKKKKIPHQLHEPDVTAIFWKTVFLAQQQLVTILTVNNFRQPLSLLYCHRENMTYFRKRLRQNSSEVFEG